jgi:hypothetical protein
MTKLVWDQADKRLYETGVDHGVLYNPNGSGVYNSGVSWNGLTTITESPSGAEPTKQYADNIVYATLQSAEEYAFTIEAYTYPDEFGQCDGSYEEVPGVKIHQQLRKIFGLSYRTKVGNALNSELGYKLHLVWGALAAPSEQAHATVNDSPEMAQFSWECSTTPVPVTIDGVEYRPTASMTIDSTKVDADALAALEELLYGTVSTDPSLPLPADVVAMFSGTITDVTPVAPTYNSSTDVVTIPTVTGVVYSINGVVVTTNQTITADTGVLATPLSTLYRFPAAAQRYWFFPLA